MIRNNNAGNIRYSVFNNWQGQVGKDERGFVIFDSIYYGVRAMMKLLRNDIKAGKNTIVKLINEWSPANGEGNTQLSTTNYINYVSNKTGIGINEPVMLTDIPKLVIAMTGFEHSPEDAEYLSTVEGDALISAYTNVVSTGVPMNFAGYNLPEFDVEVIDPIYATLAIAVAVVLIIIYTA